MRRKRLLYRVIILAWKPKFKILKIKNSLLQSALTLIYQKIKKQIEEASSIIFVYLNQSFQKKFCYLCIFKLWVSGKEWLERKAAPASLLQPPINNNEIMIKKSHFFIKYTPPFHIIFIRSFHAVIKNIPCIRFRQTLM